MIAGLFLNPWVLLVAAALISVPIIIHLINRMRFKRIQWAAMEFLLKAQKRTRRRLIIEQLLLLALRCLLIALVGLLLLRFVGCSDANIGGKPNLHIVLLDDSLSMQDLVKGDDGGIRPVFDIAKQDILIKKIGKGLSKSKSNDELRVVLLSKLREPGYEPKSFINLNDTQKRTEFEQWVNELEPSALHVTMQEGVKLAKTWVGEGTDSRATLHLVSDYRFNDWAGKNGEPIYRDLIELVRANKEIKIRPIDPVLPARRTGVPPHNENVGIVDFRPNTRVVGYRTVVKFTVTIANYGAKQIDVKLSARNEETGVELVQLNYDVQNAKADKTRITLSSGSETVVTFGYGDLRNGGYLLPDAPRPGESKFAHLSIKLVNDQLNPLENDGILLDNTRHAVVEVRDKVPILVVDGEPPLDRNKAEGKDSFILDRALGAIPGSSYQIEFAKQVSALEQTDLPKYSTIFLANVRELNEKQLTNLENFVSQGGGVAFFMGPTVNPTFYNTKLYKKGEGIFPVPLKNINPPLIEKELPDGDGETEQLLIREDNFGGKLENVPIFKDVFEDPTTRRALRHMPIRRYFKVDTNNWKKEPGLVHELASLPNDNPASAYDERVASITLAGRNERVRTILADPKLDKYRKRLQEHLDKIQEVAKVGSPVEYKGFHLASRIQALFNDPGSRDSKPPVPAMTDFWATGNEDIEALKKELTTLRNDVSYGDPFIITRKFGKGKVVAVMSTAGKDWNEWCAGSLSSVTFLPFIFEMQNYLSSLDDDANLMVGADLAFKYDAEQYKGTNLKMVRQFAKTKAEGKAVLENKIEQFGKDDKDGKIVFSMTRHNEPGRYEYDLVDENAQGKLIAKYSHAFNVDTKKEGELARVNSDELERELVMKVNELANSKDAVRIVAPGTLDETLVPKQEDFSESPWLFLILLLVLVAEQALAVHLSFHLKSADDLPPVRTRA
jgi:hypothetical protein